MLLYWLLIGFKGISGRVPKRLWHLFKGINLILHNWAIYIALVYWWCIRFTFLGEPLVNSEIFIFRLHLPQISSVKGSVSYSIEYKLLGDYPTQCQANVFQGFCFPVKLYVANLSMKQVITFLQKAGYIGNTYQIMKTFVNGTVIQWTYLCRALSQGFNMMITCC